MSTALANGTTATTQSESDTSTKVATDAFVANIVTLGSLTTAAGGAFGTSAYDNTGTSGATIPLLNGNLTFSGNDVFSGTLNFSGLTTGTQVSCLGLTSGNAVVAQSGACGSGGGGSYTFNYPLSNSSSTVSLLYSSADFGLNGSNQLTVAASKWLNIAADQAGAAIYCHSVNGTTSYACSFSSAAALTAYTAGMWVTLYVDTTCASSCTLNIDGVGSVNVKKSNGSTDPGGALVASQPYLVEYNGTVMTMLSGTDGVFPSGISTGSGSAGCGTAPGCVSMTGTSTRPSGASGAATLESNNGGTGLLATLNGGSEVPIPTVSGSTPTNNDCAKFSVSGSLVSITDAGAGCGSGSSLFTSYQFGSQTALTGSGLYLQTTYPTIFSLAQSGSGTSGSPYVDAISLASQTQNTVFSAPNGSTGTPTFRSLVTADLPAAARLKPLGSGFGDPTNNTVMASGEVHYYTNPFACTITGWDISVDRGTATFDVWMIGSPSTAIPTSSNSITASALPAITTGTYLHSTTLTGWTTSVPAGAAFVFQTNAVGGTAPHSATFELECQI